MNTEKIARIFFKYKEPSRGLINFLDEYTEIIHYPKKNQITQRRTNQSTHLFYSFGLHSNSLLRSTGK